MKKQTYNYYKEILKNERPPCMFLDLDVLEHNIKIIKNSVSSFKIRVAGKSVRSAGILKLLKDYLGEQFVGIMSYHPLETLFLLQKGFDNILIGYPYLHHKNLLPLVKFLQQNTDKKVFFMVDLEEHLKVLDSLAKKHNITLNICVDVDCSTEYPFLHFGVYRSSIKNTKDFLSFFNKLPGYKNLKTVGIMGYEAQIAGVPDNVPGQFFKNLIVKLLKSHSIKQVIKKRREYVMIFEEVCGYKPEFVNAGGTGSVKATKKDPSITEITVGSGFYQSRLFDFYENNKLLPAVGYALEITRKPQKNIYTLAGGGYIASGSIEKIKQPVPWLPEGMKLIPTEGTGEVQTPIKYAGKLNLGEIVFFRHAKAGELAEHFNDIIVIKDGKIISRLKTYRGEGHKFL